MVAVRLRASTTTSTAARRSRCTRNDSRNTRLTRLRSTARAMRRFARASPSRAWSVGPSAAMTTNPGLTNLRPCANTARNSADCLRRAVAGNAACGTAFYLRRQALTALGTTCRQHSTTILGRHAGAETVGTLPVQITRLISSFHDGLVLAPRRTRFTLKSADSSRLLPLLQAWKMLWITCGLCARVRRQRRLTPRFFRYGVTESWLTRSGNVV